MVFLLISNFQLISFQSSGLHTNGYSLARNVLLDSGGVNCGVAASGGNVSCVIEGNSVASIPIPPDIVGTTDKLVLTIDSGNGIFSIFGQQVEFTFIEVWSWGSNCYVGCSPDAPNLHWNGCYKNLKLKDSTIPQVGGYVADGYVEDGYV